MAFDWRGTGKSTDSTTGVVGIDFAEEITGVYLDVQAAINYLAESPGVDASRIGLLTATAACNDTVRAAIGDPRVKTIVGLTFYRPMEDVLQYLQTNETPIFVVASTEDIRPEGINLAETSRIAYNASASKKSQFLLYDDAGRSTGMLDAKPELSGMIERWLGEHLAGDSPS